MWWRTLFVFFVRRVRVYKIDDSVCWFCLKCVFDPQKGLLEKVRQFSLLPATNCWTFATLASNCLVDNNVGSSCLSAHQETERVESKVITKLWNKWGFHSNHVIEFKYQNKTCGHWSIENCSKCSEVKNVCLFCSAQKWSIRFNELSEMKRFVWWLWGHCGESHRLSSGIASEYLLPLSLINAFNTFVLWSQEQNQTIHQPLVFELSWKSFHVFIFFWRCLINDLLH